MFFKSDKEIFMYQKKYTFSSVNLGVRKFVRSMVRQLHFNILSDLAGSS